MNADPAKYDPNVIIAAANDKLAAADWQGGQRIYQSALLDWVDDARESGGNDVIREAVATLWLAYAHFLIEGKQFKSATEAYEQAVTCPVAGEVGRVWLDYARFLADRGRLKSAQDAYIRALVGTTEQPTAAVTDEQDRNLLWEVFLEMMQQNNPDLTMEELKEAVELEQPEEDKKNASAPVPGQVLSSIPTESHEGTGSMTPPAKRARLEEGATKMAIESSTHVVTAEGIQVEATALQDLVAGLPPDLEAAWMLRDGNGGAHPPEPPLFQPAPPKLSDATAKDILGLDLAVQLAERLVSDSGSLLLEVCSGLWAMQALKEKEAAKALSALDKSMMVEWERLETNLDARLAVAGAAATAVQQMNQNERHNFEHNCGQQRQGLLTNIAWELRQLLFVQQQILTHLRVPTFEGPTVDAHMLGIQANVCSYLHSAFYLRQRIGEERHVKMISSQLVKLKEQEQAHTQSPVPPTSSYQPPPPPPAYYQPPQQMGMPPLPPPPPPLPPPGYGGPPNMPPPPPYGGPPAYPPNYYR